MEPFSEQLAKVFLGYGITGAVALVAMFVAWKKDAEVRAVHNARIEDTKAMLAAYNELSRDMDNTLNTAMEALRARRGDQP